MAQYSLLAEVCHRWAAPHGAPLPTSGFACVNRAALIRHGRLQATEMPPILVASAVALATLLNPGLDGAVVLSSYADCGTMAAVGGLGRVGVEILARLSAGGAVNVEGLAWRV